MQHQLITKQNKNSFFESHSLKIYSFIPQYKSKTNKKIFFFFIFMLMFKLLVLNFIISYLVLPEKISNLTFLQLDM